ncbi:MAG: glycogen synthase GlgA [Clostridiales bacterium]|jgi:starch synthase|nr:glycogen synthase GlgA [Clostridiales bacterium]
MPTKKTTQTTESKETAAKKPAAQKAVKADKTPPRTAASASAKKAAPVKAAESVKRRVLFVSGEVLPFVGTGGLGEVAGSLPQAINGLNAGYEVRVILPYYSLVIPEEYKKDFVFLGSITVHLSWRSQYCGVYEYTFGNVRYYFLDNEYYFKRANVYGHFDDGERFAFFSKAVIDVLPLIDYFPDILHVNDWQTALVPIYYKLFYQYQYRYCDIKTIFTIHNIEYQGKFPKECMEDLLGISSAEYFSLEHSGNVNLMKGAIDYSDAVSTVSPTYASEILSDYYAHDLAGVLAKNRRKLSGILNGIDVNFYDPSVDKALFANYGSGDISGKVENKIELQRMLDLTVNPDIPMITVVSRLVAHKGIDILKGLCGELLASDVQLVILGKGDAEYEAYFAHQQRQYPHKIAAIIAYNKDLSRKIYAAGDIFLMPSKSEPCGLAQMIASRYGTVPVVRETGGLYDSIHDCGDAGDAGNGFTFALYTAQDFLHAVHRALNLYKNKESWNKLCAKIMEVDFSWNLSAREYIKLYDATLNR